MLMAQTAWHYVVFGELKDKTRADVHVIREPKKFQTPKEERRYHHRMYCQKRGAYDKAVLYHQEHDDPALPVVSRRGAPLLPSLASRDEPTIEPRKAFYRWKYDDPAVSTVDTPEAANEPSLTTERWIKVQSRAARRHQKRREQEETVRRQRAQYDEMFRYCRARDDPLVLVVGSHGLLVKPSLVYRNTPTFEPGPHGILQVKDKPKKVTFDEGSRQYFKSTVVDGVPGHVIEVVDDGPHPFMETARGEKCGFLRRGGDKYKPGRYADKDGWYWEDMPDFEDAEDTTDSAEDEWVDDDLVDFRDSMDAAASIYGEFNFGPGKKGKSNKTSSGAAFGFLLGGGKVDETSGPPGDKGNVSSLSTGTFPGWTALNRRKSEQQQKEESLIRDDEEPGESRADTASTARLTRVFPPFAKKDSIGGGERSPGDINKKAEETKECDIFEDAQESLIPPASLGRPPQHQEIFAQSEPIDEEGSPIQDNNVGEQNEETDEHDVFEDAQENLPSPPPSARSPHEREAFDFTHFDPFGGDEGLSGSDDDDNDGGVDKQDGNTDYQGAFERAQGGLHSAHLQHLPQQRRSAIPQFDPFGSDEEPEAPKETGQCDSPETGLTRPKGSSQQQTFARYDLFDVDGDPEETDQCAISESAHASLSSPARPRHSSISSDDWMMPVSEELL